MVKIKTITALKSAPTFMLLRRFPAPTRLQNTDESLIFQAPFVPILILTGRVPAR